MVFSGIVRYIPAGSFQMKAALGNQLMKMTGTFIAGAQRFVGKILNSFFHSAALGAFVFINWHVTILLK